LPHMAPAQHKDNEGTYPERETILVDELRS
jgi:hypothetical protein